MIPARQNSSVAMLAVFGLALPYLVAVLPSVLFRERIRSMDFYMSGGLATFDTVTAWLTFGAFVMGAALCGPWLRARFAGTLSRVRWIACGVAALGVQLVAVFVVRFLVYLSSGGIL